MTDDNLLSLHWSFGAVRKTIAQHGEKELYTCASGITPSGVIHIGNFRETITVDLVKRAFKRMGKNVRHIHSWDDNDVFRKVPANMPQQDMLKEHLRKCIVDVPDPFGETENYASKHMKDIEESIARVGINPEFIRQSVKYRNCDYAEDIKKALDNTDAIKSILNEYRKEDLADDWLPVSIFCPKCMKDTFVSLKRDGDYTLSFICECGHEETFDFREKGYAKLLWRVDWPMRWAYENVNFEPGGKDHSTVGGSYDTGKKISEQIWGHTAPSYLMYDFVRIKGAGGKISSSTGNVITVNSCLEIYEPEILRYLFVGTRPNTEFAISFDTDVFKLYEDYDKCERIFYGKEEAKEREVAKQKLIYEFSQLDENIENISKEMPIQINFRHITTILQIKDMDEKATLEYFREEIKNPKDEERLAIRISCVKNWLDKYADEQFKFSVKSERDEGYLASLDEKSKKALELLKKAMETTNTEDELSTAIFAIPKELEMEMSVFFTLCYQTIVGKEKGPKLAAFIMEIGRDRIIPLL